MNKALFHWAQGARRALLVTIVFAVLAAVVTIVQMSLLSRVVNRVFLGHEGLAQVGGLLLLLLVGILVHAMFVWVRTVTAEQGAVRVKMELRERLLAQLFALGPAYVKGEQTGELVAVLGEGVERLDPYISRYLPQVVLSVLVPLLIAGYILPLDWSSSVLLLATCPVIPLLMVLVGKYAEAHIQRQWVALSRMSAHFLDAIQGLPTLKLFGRSTRERERIASISNAFREKTMKVLQLAFLSGAVLEFLAMVAIGLVAVTLGVRLLNGNISFETALLVLLLAPEFYRPLRDLGVHHHAGMEGKAVAKRIIEVLETPVVRMNSIYTPDSVSMPIRGVTLELNDVTYTYPGSEQPALKGVSLTLLEGSCTALVGRSGAGKSTLVNLLMRFIEPEHGTIRVNGTMLVELSLEGWREKVALVPQRPYLFDESVRDNIRLARPSASDEEVAQAAELAGATEFIARLPQGYETRLGEQGARLSAGQAQRIALARAFLKDTPLLLLDEPTSSLDPASEALIRQALERLMHKRTVLVIAHRLNTIASAQQVVVLDEGQVVEIGVPQQLLQGDGPYARLMSAYRKGPLLV